MAKSPAPSAFDAILAVLGKGTRVSTTQLLERVAKKTKRPLALNTLRVRLSELRRQGYTINTFRGSQSRAKDGSTQYQLVN